MVLIDELLIQLRNSDNMDFCEDLVNIQSIFNYANEYIKPLNKIQFRGGKFKEKLHLLSQFKMFAILFQVTNHTLKILSTNCQNYWSNANTLMWKQSNRNQNMRLNSVK